MNKEQRAFADGAESARENAADTVDALFERAETCALPTPTSDEILFAIRHA